MSSVVNPVIDGAVRRLTVEFAGRLSPYAVAEVVALARRDLDSCPPPALAELLERLARQRLIDVFSSTAAAP